MPEKSREKGLVMEIAPEEIIVLTPTGEFKSLVWRKAPLPEVGSEITFEEVIPASQRFTSVKFLVLAASLLFCFFSLPFLSSLFPVSRQVVAYVSIDINPSVELGLDEKGIVREVIGLNEDGVNLLKTLKVLNYPVEKAVRLITDEAAKKHYLASDKDNNILVTFSTREENDQAKVPANAQVLARLENALDAGVKTTALQERNIQVQVELLEVSAQIQQQARENGLSAGKYAVMLEAQQAGLEINVDDLKFSNVVKAIKDAGGIPGQIISKAKQDEKRLPEWANELKKRKMKENEQNNDGKGPDGNNGQNKDKQPQQKKEQAQDNKLEKTRDKDQSQNKPGKNVSPSRMNPASENKADAKKVDAKKTDEKGPDEKNKQGKNVH